MASRVVSLKWSDEFLARVDVARGGVSRNEFVRRALEAALPGGADRPVVGTPAAVVRPVAPLRAPAFETAVQRNIRLADERRLRS